MTDDPESAVAERTDDVTETEEEAETTEGAREIVTPEAVAVDATPVSETTEADSETAGSGGDDTPPTDAPDAADDDDAAAAPVGKRRINQLLGTLLIVAGLLTIALTIGITAWNRHQHDAETRAFLARVTTPTALSIPAARATQTGNNNPTPFPSTVSGALVPDTARTPTANVATRAAQPVATTSNGLDRTILAAPPAAPSAVPATAAPGSAAPTPAPTPAPRPQMPLPIHLAIPAIKVNSDIVEVGVSPVNVDGQDAFIWDVAPYAVGHHFSSASPGEGENVVLSGHDDWQGEVFKNLYKLKKGDEIDLQAGDRQITYHVDDILLLPEVGESLDKRIQNAAFIGTTGDERLTLVTCWPYAVDDHRLIVIARPNQ